MDPQIIHSNMIFPSKPSILGDTPIQLWYLPYISYN